MKTTLAVALAITCCLAAGFVTTSSDDSRQLQELSKRVAKLESSQGTTGQALSRLAKSVADLESQLKASHRPGRNQGTNQEELDKRLDAVEKSLKSLSSTVTELQKQIGPKGDGLAPIHKKIDARTEKLAEWFDQYHPHSGQGYYHRDGIKRIH